MRIGPLLAGLLLAWPAAGRAYEPRFDHRDQAGLATELVLAHDTLMEAGEPTGSQGRLAVRLAGTLDPFGEGNELIAGLQLPLSSTAEPGAPSLGAIGDLRYRGYAGTEELKTFFELGLWLAAKPRVVAGPVAGLGLQYDLSRTLGAYLRLGFAPGIGPLRVATIDAAVGVQVRFDAE